MRRLVSRRPNQSSTAGSSTDPVRPNHGRHRPNQSSTAGSSTDPVRPNYGRNQPNTVQPHNFPAHPLSKGKGKGKWQPYGPVVPSDSGEDEEVQSSSSDTPPPPPPPRRHREPRGRRPPTPMPSPTPSPPSSHHGWDPPIEGPASESSRTSSRLDAGHPAQSMASPSWDPEYGDSALQNGAYSSEEPPVSSADAPLQSGQSTASSVGWDPDYADQALEAGLVPLDNLNEDPASTVATSDSGVEEQVEEAYSSGEDNVEEGNAEDSDDLPLATLGEREWYRSRNQPDHNYNAEDSDDLPVATLPQRER